jgi:hypothetical protein
MIVQAGQRVQVGVYCPWADKRCLRLESSRRLVLAGAALFDGALPRAWRDAEIMGWANSGATRLISTTIWILRRRGDQAALSFFEVVRHASRDESIDFAQERG